MRALESLGIMPCMAAAYSHRTSSSLSIGRSPVYYWSACIKSIFQKYPQPVAKKIVRARKRDTPCIVVDQHMGKNLWLHA